MDISLEDMLNNLLNLLSMAHSLGQGTAVIQRAPRYLVDQLPDVTVTHSATKVGKYTLPKRMVTRPLVMKNGLTVRAR